MKFKNVKPGILVQAKRDSCDDFVKEGAIGIVLDDPDVGDIPPDADGTMCLVLWLNGEYESPVFGKIGDPVSWWIGCDSIRKLKPEEVES